MPVAEYAQGICENYISQRLTTSEKPTLYAEIEYIEFAKFYDFASRGALLPLEHKSQDILFREFRQILDGAWRAKFKNLRLQTLDFILNFF